MSRRGLRHPRWLRCRGMTLVELMIGLALGLFLVGVAGTLFVGSRMTFSAQSQVGRLQESARFAAERLGADLRMAGFRGCKGYGSGTAITSVLSSPGDFQIDFGRGLWASRHDGSAWVPALDSSIASLSPAPDRRGDVVTVRRTVGPGWALTAAMSAPDAVLNVTPTAAIGRGDLLLVSDCAGSVVLQATNATPGSDGAIEHSASGGLSPGNSQLSLGRVFLQDALVHRLATTTYYLAPSRRSGRTSQLALWSFTSPAYAGSSQPQELFTGVERLAVRLGLDTNADGTADAFVTPGQVVDWLQVVSVETSLLLVSLEDQVSTAPQQVVFDGTTIVPTDRRLRSVVTFTASLRNSVR
ncbi:MAG: PilW family protein [Sphaerotilus natans]